MCRMFGAVAAAPVSVRRELVAAENPLVRQAEQHDSGWGMAVYGDIPCANPMIERFAVAATTDQRFAAATAAEGRIFNVHVRRATLGGITPENTHPFDFGPYTFCHNGTILDPRPLLRPNMPKPRGDTDSEHFFLRLLNEYDPSHPVRSIRGVVASIVAATPFSGLNFLFSDGVKLYAYKLGVFDLYWNTRAGVGMVASEKLTAESWHTFEQDVIMVFDPERPEEPIAQRLVGDMLVNQARIERLEPPAELRGVERGEFAHLRAQIMRERANGSPDGMPMKPEDLPLTPA